MDQIINSLSYSSCDMNVHSDLGFRITCNFIIFYYLQTDYGFGVFYHCSHRKAKEGVRYGLHPSVTTVLKPLHEFRKM